MGVAEAIGISALIVSVGYVAMMAIGIERRIAVQVCAGFMISLSLYLSAVSAWGPI